MTAHRYTLVGDAYMVSVADSAGEGINSYALNGAAKVCLPLPSCRTLEHLRHRVGSQTVPTARCRSCLAPSALRARQARTYADT